MKRVEVLVLFLVVILSMSSVMASVSVRNLTVTKTYVPYQLITGMMNVTITDTDYTFLFSSNLDNTTISLGDFLDENGADYNCTPSDCSTDYDFSGETATKIIDMQANEVYYAGFVLNGDNVEVTGLSFDLESNFGKEAQLPLKMEFFESDLWEYNEFSNEYSAKNYGCYDKTAGMPGPLIRTSEYCEKIHIIETDSLEIGAEVDNEDNKNLRMAVYSDFAGSSLGECEFNPPSASGCQIYADTGEVYEAGDYYVCVSAPTGGTTNYHLYSEFSGTDCGFVYSSNPGNFTKDYSVFAKTALYEAAKTNNQSNLILPDELFDDFIISANEILNERYSGDCSDGCVLPFVMQGVSQNLIIKNLVLDYRADGEDKNPENKIYDLEVKPALVDFSGILDLELLGFEVPPKSSEIILYLDGNKIFSKDIKMLAAPIVKSVSPVNPPAGVPITFYAGVDYNGTISSYVWDFGDGTTETTLIKKVKHTYREVGNYTLELEVIADNLSNSASFEIETINPENAINISLKKMNTDLDNTLKEINKFPAWYQDVLKEVAQTVYYRGELNRLEKDFEQEAFTNSDYVDIATELYALNVPESIFVSSQISGPLMTELDEIDAQPVQMIGGGNEENLDGYKNPILRWQSDNIEADILSKKIVLVRESSETEEIMMVYDVNVKSNADEESFFVIKKDFSTLFFNSASDPNARKEGDASVIVLDEGGAADFEFYYLAVEGVADESAMFVSPKLNHLILEADIDTTCDYDNICENGMGENTSTCKNDCKPVFRMVLYIVLIFIFVLILYIILQMWYKARYETWLFKDRRHLYNLLMFIANARAQRLDDSKIRAALKKQNWKNEQINYALKKSRGERTGLYEIIPVEKIFAGLRQRKANKKFAAGNMQQNTQKLINH